MDQLSTGELLRRHRFRAGITQRELATRAALSVRAVRYIEQGLIARPQAASVRRLADALGLTGADLDQLGDTHRAPSAEVRVAALGPVTVYQGEASTGVASAPVRTLLGLLAIQPGREVGADEIVDVLWGDRPPRTCAQLVHTHVAALRRILEPDRSRRTPAVALRRTRSGYTLDLGPAGTDVQRFTELARSSAAARQSGQCGLAEQLGGQALALWRGPAVPDCGIRLRLHPVVVALAARRHNVAIDHADLAIAAGNGARLVPSLRALVAEEPLHEGLAARLMSALADDGQQAAALEAFTTIRTRLDEELGVQPGEHLRATYLRVLRGEPAGRPVVAGGSPPARGPVPAQLPVDVATFTGRAEHLRRLDAHLTEPAGQPRKGGRPTTTTVAISTLDGMAGVGKTALAVHWAHRVRDRFPDGQLYVDLRGHASTRPLRSIDALSGFLLALGVPPETVPDDVDRAAMLYRSVLAGRRMLVVLDNAVSADQVRPLLASTPGSLVLVTSRNRIPGLVARDGADQMTIGVLAPDEALALLRRMLGDARADAEPEALAELARLCAYLPLALRIAAANLIARPRHRIADHVAKLAGNRLAALSVDGDADTAVQATFDLSYAALPPTERRVFRALGHFPGPAMSIEVAAALTGTAAGECARLLSRLVDRHLADEPVPGRFTMHDLVRLYAAERSTTRERDETADRLADFYLDAADTATRILNPHLLRMPPDPARPGGRPVDLADHGPALAWLDDERANLVAVVSRLAAQQRTTAAVRLADTLHAYFRVRINPADWQTVCLTARSAAETGGDPVAQAATELHLGGMYNFQSHFQLANGHFTRALALARQAGWTECEGVALNNLARMHWLAGRPKDTIVHLEQALALHRRARRVAGEAVTLANLGAAYGVLGRAAGPTTVAGRADLDRAMAHLDQALVLHRKIDDRRNEADTLRVLADAHRDVGDLDEAIALATEALNLARAMDDLRFEVSALNTLASVNARIGAADRAYDQHRCALRIVRELGDRHLEAQTLIESARTDLRLGHPGQAATQLRAAMAIIDDIDDRLLERQARSVLDAIR